MTVPRCSWIALLLAMAGLCMKLMAADTPAESPAPKVAAPTYTRGGADTCLGCHDDELTLAIFRGPHGVPGNPHAPFGHEQLQCEACHGPGGTHARKPKKGETRPPVIRFGRDSATPVLVQNGMCSTCHQADLGVGWHASAHASNEVPCASCHRSHTARDPILARATQSDVCATCHQIERMDQHRPYAHPLDAGKMSCTACHSVHGSAHETLLKAATTNDTCFQCHADKRGPFLWEHAPVAEDCTSCHAPHGSINPGMLKMRGPMLCQSCHSEPNHASLAPIPAAGLPGGQRSPYVLGMNCLNCHSQVHGSNHPSGSKLMR